MSFFYLAKKPHPSSPSSNQDSAFQKIYQVSRFAGFSKISNILPFLFSVTLLVSTLAIGTSHSQILPDGERWKDIAGDQTLIGSIIGPGTYLPINTQEQWKINSQNVLLRECSAGTVLSYPTITWLGPYEYDFDNFNTAVNWLEDNNKVQIAHLLAGGYNYHPQWFIDGRYSHAELKNMLEQFIKTAIQSNDNDEKVDIWNVVNEVFAVREGTNFQIRLSKFNALGHEPDASGFTGEDSVISRFPIYVRLAFEYARKYTDKKLELRDNNCEFSGQKHDKLLYQLAAHLKNKGVPVDAIGFQAHLSVERDYDWNDFKNQILKYQNLGYEVNITEVDIGNSGPSDNEAQRQIAYDVVRAAREAGVGYINFWGLRDTGGGPRGPDRHRHFFETADFIPKPSYYGVQAALEDTQLNAPEAPIAPLSLKAIELSSNEIRLNWIDSASNETGFYLERKDLNGTYSVIDSIAANTTSYLDSGLASSSTYFYRIAAYNEVGNSDYSNEATATTNDNPIDPADSTILVFTPVADTYINNTLPNGNFGDKSNVAIQGGQNRILSTLMRFQLTGLNGKKVTGAKLLFKESPAGSLSNQNSPFSIRQIDGSWEENTVNWNTAPAPDTMEIGSMPRTDIQENETIEVILDPEVFKNNGAFNFMMIATGPGNDLRLYSREGVTAPRLVLMTELSGPKAPLSLTANTISNSEIRVNWIDSASNETGFYLERKDLNGTYSVIDSIAANTTSYLDSGLASSSTYFYRIVAYNEVGNSGYSNEATAITDDDPIDPVDSTLFIFTPIADTYINSTLPDRNFGDKSNVAVQGGQNRILSTLMRFQLTGLEGREVTGAKLLFKESPAGSLSNQNSPFSIRQIDGNWEENTVNWNTAPTPDTMEIGSMPRTDIQEDETIEVILDPEVFKNNGALNFMMIATGPGNDLRLYSREGTTAPRLLLMTKELISEDTLSGEWRIQNLANQHWIGTECQTVFDQSVALSVAANDVLDDCTKFTFIPTVGDFFYIQNVSTGGKFAPKLCATNSNDKIEIAQVPESRTDWCVQWKLVDAGEGYYRIQNRGTGHWIRPKGCSATVGRPITQVSTSYSGSCTKWKLIKAGHESLTTLASKPAPIANTIFSSLEEGRVKAYPNPASDELNLQLTSTSTDIQNINIYDLQGRVVRQVSDPDPTAQGQLKVNLADLKDGTYILSIEFNGRESQKSKFLVRRQ